MCLAIVCQTVNPVHGRTKVSATTCFAENTCSIWALKILFVPITSLKSSIERFKRARYRLYLVGKLFKFRATSLLRQCSGFWDTAAAGRPFTQIELESWSLCSLLWLARRVQFEQEKIGRIRKWNCARSCGVNCVKCYTIRTYRLKAKIISRTGGLKSIHVNVSDGLPLNSRYYIMFLCIFLLTC